MTGRDDAYADIIAHDLLAGRRLYDGYDVDPVVLVDALAKEAERVPRDVVKLMLRRRGR